jgi:hypothetical protein
MCGDARFWDRGVAEADRYLDLRRVGRRSPTSRAQMGKLLSCEVRVVRNSPD